MIEAVLLMLLTGIVWAAVGVLFGTALDIFGIALLSCRAKPGG